MNTTDELATWMSNSNVSVDTLVLYLKTCQMMPVGLSCRLLWFVLVQGVLEKKKNKGILKLGQNRSGGVVVSQKQGFFPVQIIVQYNTI